MHYYAITIEGIISLPDSQSHLVIGEGGDLLRRHGDVGAETLAASLEHRVVIRGEAHLDSGGQNM